VVQELQSIAIQLVRNAVSHGIETPAERNALNKLPVGEISIRLENPGNGDYDFIVRDDGHGIVPAHLRNQLVATGRLTKEEVAAMSDIEVARYIFQPGVSTARRSANRDAGHGVGLDAVMEKIKGIQGYMQVKSSPNLFTEFHAHFKLPA
jgi:chemotaxis protein histidine kinase CheA